MITAEQVRTVIDRDVWDNDGNKIGNAKNVFLDDVTGAPQWVSVKTGLLGTGESFVPIKEASMVDGHLEVPYDKDTVKHAPSVDVDARGHLSKDEERRLYEHYGLGNGAVRRGQSGEKGMAGAGTGVAAGAAAGTGTAAGGRTTNGYGTDAAAATGAAAGTHAHAGHGAGMGTAGRAGTAEKDADAAHRGMTGDGAMTRSEERMIVHTERQEAGHARLHKYVVTEEQEQTVPVRHEEVRIERVPITDADRAAVAGTEISEAEHEVTLYEERPVAQIETVPVERVRLVTEEVTEQQTVRGTVRKEQIETETDVEARRKGSKH